MSMRVFLVVRCRCLTCADQDFPGAAGVEKALGRSLVASEFDLGALGPAGDFERERSRRGGVKRARGVIVRIRGEERRKFLAFRIKAFPAIPEAVIDDGASAKNLLHSRDVFCSDAQNHVDQFGEAKHLLHDGAHGYIAGVFLGEAHRDGFRQRHVQNGDEAARVKAQITQLRFSRFEKAGRGPGR